MEQDRVLQLSKVQRFESTLLEVKQITPTVKHYTFSTPKEFTFKAGQYAMLILQIDQENKVRRPYSIASPPLEKGKISLSVKKVDGGKGTCYMAYSQKYSINFFLCDLICFPIL